jgi:Skp family chaperone for outer membrane proteins
MKKILSGLIVLAFIFSLSANVFAAATSLGFIDVEKVFYGYKDTKKALDKLSDKEKEFKALKE